MSKELEASKPGCSTLGFFLWFLGGISLSISIIFSLILLALLIASIGLNIYLGWRLSGMEITIRRAAPIPPQVVTATPAAEAVVVRIASPVRWASAMIVIIGFVPEEVGNALASPIHTPGVSCSSPYGFATLRCGSAPMRQVPI